MEQNDLYVGIDVSKGYADFAVMNRDKQLLDEVFRLYDTPDGHAQLLALTAQWLVSGYGHVSFGVESTGGYENNWVSYLQQLQQELPVRIARINPKGVKCLRDASLVRTITDGVSAESIGWYLIDFAHKIDYLQPANAAQVPYAEGRKHNTLIRMLKKQRNQLGNQLEKILYQHLSGYVCYCRHGLPVWLLVLLQKYPGAAFIKKAGVKKLAALPGISTEKAEALIGKLGSVVQPDSAVVSRVIKSTAQQMLHLQCSIKEEKKFLIDQYKNTEAVVLLQSVPGIGEQSAVEYLIEIEDINRFATASKLNAYFGTHPVWKQSGDSTWGNHMSKKGRSEIRSVLYMSSLTAIRNDELFKRIYARARAKGKNHYSAMGVVMNKMLRIIYGILKHQKPYNHQTDENNQQQAQSRQQEKQTEQIAAGSLYKTRLERFSEETIEQAPVSKQYAKKKRRSPKLQKEASTGSSASENKLIN